MENLENLINFLSFIITNKKLNYLTIYYYLDRFNLIHNFKNILNEKSLLNYVLTDLILYINNDTDKFNLLKQCIDELKDKINFIERYKNEYKFYLEEYHRDLHKLIEYQIILKELTEKLDKVNSDLELYYKENNKNLIIRGTNEYENIKKEIENIKSEIKKIKVPKFPIEEVDEKFNILDLDYYYQKRLYELNKLIIDETDEDRKRELIIKYNEIWEKMKNKGEFKKYEINQ